MLAIIDFGAGNLRSVENALLKLGERPLVTNRPEEVLEAEKIVFPGVGCFGQAMKVLGGRALGGAVKKVIADGKPFLGICLGMQLLFERSEECPKVRGLGVLGGRAKRFPLGQKVPQIGWNQLAFKRKSVLLQGLESGCFVYFVHSYYVEPLDESIVVAETGYGLEYCSVIESANVFATQFHPEKSGVAGLRVLRNFLELT